MDIFPGRGYSLALGLAQSSYAERVYVPGHDWAGVSWSGFLSVIALNMISVIAIICYTVIN